jgi:hypothetical protein
MIYHTEGGVRSAYATSNCLQCSKWLWRCDLMDKMTVNVQQRSLTWNFAHYMSLPDFLEHCSWTGFLIHW